MADRLRVVSWNVDGLMEEGRIERAHCACDLLLALSPPPDIILLQEVVPTTLDIIRSRFKRPTTATGSGGGGGGGGGFKSRDLTRPVSDGDAKLSSAAAVGGGGGGGGGSDAPYYQLLTPGVNTQNAAFYFCVALIRRPPLNVLRSSCHAFETTDMGRHVLSAECVLTVANPTASKPPVSVRLTVSTAHFESTMDGDAGPERMQQARYVLNNCLTNHSYSKQQQSSSTAVRAWLFAGDTNLREKEVGLLQAKSAAARSSGGGWPESVHDAWVSAGQPSDTRYSWDCERNSNLQMSSSVSAAAASRGSSYATKPRSRYDRMWYNFPPESLLRVQSFQLLGTTALTPTELSRSVTAATGAKPPHPAPARPLFPSDHFAICVDFSVSVAAGNSENAASAGGGGGGGADSKRLSVAEMNAKRAAVSSGMAKLFGGAAANNKRKAVESKQSEESKTDSKPADPPPPPPPPPPQPQPAVTESTEPERPLKRPRETDTKTAAHRPRHLPRQ